MAPIGGAGLRDAEREEGETADSHHPTAEEPVRPAEVRRRDTGQRHPHRQAHRRVVHRRRDREHAVQQLGHSPLATRPTTNPETATAAAATNMESTSRHWRRRPAITSRKQHHRISESWAMRQSGSRIPGRSVTRSAMACSNAPIGEPARNAYTVSTTVVTTSIVMSVGRRSRGASGGTAKNRPARPRLASSVTASSWLSRVGRNMLVTRHLPCSSGSFRPGRNLAAARIG